MWAIWGFILAAGIGLAVVHGAGRSGAVRRDEYPWLLDEISKLHVMIVGNLAGFAFTGIVLVVTLARNRVGSGVAQLSLDAVIIMFFVAYLYWVGAAFLISFLPHVRMAGDFVQRLHFGLASTIEYRTVFLSWFALLPLLQANGFGRLSQILYFLVPASLLIGSLLLAMATDGLGLVDVRETYFSAAVGTGLALAYAAIVAVAAPAARSAYSPIYLALVIFCLNGAGFVLAALTPLSPRYVGIQRFFERNGRQIVVADMQLTMVSLAFLWLAVVGVI
ncbi:MAG: hypothetical protein ACREM2_02840 [Vulcanimicrobiaceae bacterium]